MRVSKDVDAPCAWADEASSQQSQEPMFKTLLSHLNSVTAIPREVAGAVMLANGLALTSAIATL
jgi:hypothetical protein